MSSLDALCPEPDCGLTVRQHLAQLREILARPWAPMRTEHSHDEHADKIRQQARQLLREGHR
jgi:hypothetical protein